MSKENNLPSTLTNEENVSEKGFYCYGKKDFCHKGNDNTVKCDDCEFFNDEGGELLLINENKSNNFDVKSNEELFKQALVEGVSRHFDKTIEQAKRIDYMKLDLLDSIVWKKLDDGATALDIDRTAENLHSIGYRKQSEVIEEYRQRVNTKMGKHTHLLGKEYVQRILREVAKEMKGGA